MKWITKEKGFYKQVMMITAPIMVQSLITIGVNLADNIMVGKLGETSLSGVTLANEFINFFQICCMGIGMGASVMTARFFGARNQHALKQAVTIMLRLCAVFSFVFTAAAVLFPNLILSIYTSDIYVAQMGVSYLQYSVPRFFLICFTLTLTIVLRSVGQMRVAMVTSFLAFLMNIVLNALLIFGLAGFPALGVRGAAIATVIARIFECMVISCYFFLLEKKIHYRIRDITMDCHELIEEYFRISIPVLISDALLGLGNSVVAMVIGHLGESFVAANAITNTTRQLSTVFIQGTSQSGCIIVGQTLGRGSTELAQEEGEAFFGLGVFLGLISAVVIQIIGGTMIGFYNISEGTRQITEELMMAISFIVFFQSCNGIMTKGVLRGGGDTRFLMYADILFLWVLSIPLGILAGFVWKLTPFLIYLCLKLDQVIKTIWSFYRLKSGKWIKIIH